MYKNGTNNKDNSRNGSNYLNMNYEFKWEFTPNDNFDEDDTEYKLFLKKMYLQSFLSSLILNKTDVNLIKTNKHKMRKKTLMKSNRRSINPKLLLIALISFIMLNIVGCGDTNVSPMGEDNTNHNLSLSLKAGGNSNDDPLNITIDEAKFLVKNIEFEVEGSENESEVEAGPFVINIDLAGGVREISTAIIPSGSYDKLKFQIHKPDDNETPSDPDFRSGSSSNQRFSFIIKGKINGENFVYKSKKSIDLEINLDSPINVQNIERNITILLTERIWFLINGNEVDPRDPGHENQIDDNLKNSFSRAFKDDDHNGEPDGGSD